MRKKKETSAALNTVYYIVLTIKNITPSIYGYNGATGKNCHPKAEVRGSNPVGCATYIDWLGNGGAVIRRFI